MNPETKPASDGETTFKPAFEIPTKLTDYRGGAEVSNYPEGVRDAQDYKDYLEEQAARPKEATSETPLSRQDLIQANKDIITVHDGKDGKLYANRTEGFAPAISNSELAQINANAELIRDSQEEREKDYATYKAEQVEETVKTEAEIPELTPAPETPSELSDADFEAGLLDLPNYEDKNENHARYVGAMEAYDEYIAKNPAKKPLFGIFGKKKLEKEAADARASFQEELKKYMVRDTAKGDEYSALTLNTQEKRDDNNIKYLENRIKASTEWIENKTSKDENRKKEERKNLEKYTRQLALEKIKHNAKYGAKTEAKPVVIDIAAPLADAA